MSLISNFAKITEESQAEYASMKDAVLSRTDVLGDSCEGDNLLAFCDNASFMKYLRDTAGMRGKVKMIYIDPPFFSKANYEATLSVSDSAVGGGRKVRHLAYEDVWEKAWKIILR